jgi:threonine/homoserine efflux transporter RhtA
VALLLLLLCLARSVFEPFFFLSLFSLVTLLTLEAAESGCGEGLSTCGAASAPSGTAFHANWLIDSTVIGLRAHSSGVGTEGVAILVDLTPVISVPLGAVLNADCAAQSLDTRILCGVRRSYNYNVK